MKLRTFLCLVASILLLAAFIPASAQDNSITFSATGTYDGAFPHSLREARGILKSHEILPGGQVDLSAKLVKALHLATQFNYSQKPNNVQVTFTGGPEVDFGKYLFAHALVGGIHLSQKPPKVQALADSAFMYTVGGGGRVPVSKRAFINLGADYNYSEVLKSSESFWKLAAGVGFRF